MLVLALQMATLADIDLYDISKVPKIKHVVTGCERIKTKTAQRNLHWLSQLFLLTFHVMKTFSKFFWASKTGNK